MTTMEREDAGDHPARPRIGFVLSGGGSLGAVQAGMVLALAAAGILPDILTGASSGALNAAFLAAFPTIGGAEALAALWRSVRRKDVMPLRAGELLTGLSLRSPRIVSNDRLTRFIRTHLPYRQLEEAPLPVAVTATDAHSGAPVVLSSGDALAALLASTAIPGVFPPVVVDGRTLVDGSISDDQPIAAAVALGASEVFVMPSPYPDPRDLPRDPFGMALRATQHAIVRRNEVELAMVPGDVTVHVVPPPITDASTFDFSRAEELIAAGQQVTEQWLPTVVRPPEAVARWA